MVRMVRLQSLTILQSRTYSNGKFAFAHVPVRSLEVVDSSYHSADGPELHIYVDNYLHLQCRPKPRPVNTCNKNTANNEPRTGQYTVSNNETARTAPNIYSNKRTSHFPSPATNQAIPHTPPAHLHTHPTTMIYPCIPSLTHIWARLTTPQDPKTPPNCDLTTIPYSSWQPPQCAQKCNGPCTHIPAATHTLPKAQAEQCPATHGHRPRFC